MGSEFCSCQHFFIKTENESDMLSNAKRDFSTIDKKKTSDKRFEEESLANDQYYKLKDIDIQNNNKKDRINMPSNLNSDIKKKGIFNLNNSYDNENKENKDKNNEKVENTVEKNQKENNINNNKSPFKKTFTFKDDYVKSNGDTVKKEGNNSNNNNIVINNNENNNILNNQEDSSNNANNKGNLKKVFTKEEFNINNKINEEEDEYNKSQDIQYEKITKNSKINTNVQMKKKIKKTKKIKMNLK